MSSTAVGQQLDNTNSSTIISNDPQFIHSMTEIEGIYYLSNVVIVQFDEQVSNKNLQTGLSEFDAKISRYETYAIERVYPFLDYVEPTSKTQENLLALRQTYHVRYHSDVPPIEVAKDLDTSLGVIYAEPVTIYHVYDPSPEEEIPNDPEFTNQPELLQLRLPEAWDVVKGDEGSSRVVIAIVDTGADWDHEDLIGNVWTNLNEIPNNGIDDDINGFIDDIHGVNFANKDDRDNDPSSLPKSDHGTRVAGSAGAVADNGIGVAGSSWNAELMHINAYCRTWFGAGICYGYEGILYAAANGADIINASWGGRRSRSTRFEDQTIELATDMGSLIVAAAGNDSKNLDTFSQYPADHQRVLSVGATEKNTRKLARFSNYGKTVDVFAPGVRIRTTDLNNDYDYANGTSFASPLVAGVAALVKTIQPDLSPDTLREYIRINSENMDHENPQHVSLLGQGFVNALAAVNTSPSFSVIRLLRLEWTDDDGNNDNTPGEEVTITAEFRNYLTDAQNLSFELEEVESYPFLDWVKKDGEISFLPRGNSIEIDFVFRVENNAPTNKLVKFLFKVQGNEFTDYIGNLSLVINLQLAVIHGDLSSLYVSTNGENWSKNQGWNPNQVPPSFDVFEKWYGLYFENFNLISIELSNNNLRGTLPSEVGNFGNLEELDLSNNSLSGEIQSELSRLSNLGELNLSNNRLSGEIGSSLAGLTNLDELNLSNNLLSGTIPIELENLTNIDLINLSENKLSGEIPPEIGTLRNLDALDVSNNQLTGAIPAELGGLINTVDLNLSNNKLQGVIPPELGNLRNIAGLNLSNNELSGEIPLQLSNLKNIDELDISDNQFTGALPRDFTKLYLLRSLSHSNSGACAPGDDEFQSWVKSLDKYTGKKCPSVSFTRTIDDLKFSINQPIVPVFFPVASGGVSPITYKITPQLPKGLMYDSLNNAVFGSPVESLPKTIFSYIATDAIGSQDSITFSISVDLSTVQGIYNTLREIFEICESCANWNFSQAPQDLSYFANWEGLKFSGNRRLIGLNIRVRGQLPSVIGNLVTLQNLSIFGLLGKIPSEIGNLTNLERLNISGGSSNGELPPEIGNLENLNQLRLNGNQFSGSLPRTLMKVDNLDVLEFYRSEGLCAPIELDFQVWLRSVRQVGGPNCSQYQNYFEYLIDKVTYFQGRGQTRILPSFETGFSPYSYSIDPALPAGMHFDSASRELSGVPTQESSHYTYTYTAIDAIGFSGTLNFNLGVIPYQNYFSSDISDISFIKNRQITPITLPEFQSGNLPNEYAIFPELPEGLKFNPTTRVISGLPSELSPKKSYSYIASDAGGLQDRLQFTITIYENKNYFSSEIPELTYFRNRQINPITLPEFQSGNPPYAYIISPDLPSGLKFNATSRELSGTPTEIVPKKSYTYTATDNIGLQDSLMFNLHILPIPALTFNRKIPNQSFPNRQRIPDLYLPVVSGNVGAVEYSLSPTLPEGLSFELSSHSGRPIPWIVGTPTEVTTAILYTYTATHERSGAKASLSFTITVFSPVARDQESLPNHFILHSNYPNPFRENTRLKFDLPSVANVSVEVFDVLGKRVIFHSPENLSPGWSREIEINGVNLSSGAYLYRLLINSQNENVIHFGRFVKIQ